MGPHYIVCSVLHLDGSVPLTPHHYVLATDFFSLFFSSFVSKIPPIIGNFSRFFSLVFFMSHPFLILPPKYP